jgi:hypothetical protein
MQNSVRLEVRVHVKLLIDALYVSTRSVLTDSEPSGDVGRTEALSEKFGDLNLARGQAIRIAQADSV